MNVPGPTVLPLLEMPVSGMLRGLDRLLLLLMLLVPARNLPAGPPWQGLMIFCPVPADAVNGCPLCSCTWLVSV